MAYYHCLLLDVDGTMMDFAAAEHKAFHETMSEFGLPATAMANEAGVPTLANMVMMGHVLQHNPELSFNGTEVTVQKLVPPKKAQLVELNMKALEAGRDYAG